MRENKNSKKPQNGVEKPRKKPGYIPLFGSIRGLCFSAMLAAMSILLGKFLQIPTPLHEVVRISFENLPILMAGITMGPIVGGVTGVVADLIGCVAYGYTINPIVTLGAAAVGVVSGAFAYFIFRRPGVLQVALAVAAAHLVGSVLIKTWGLAGWYLAKYSIGFAELLLWRLLNYLLIGTAEGFILCQFFRHKAFAAQMERMRNP